MVKKNPVDRPCIEDLKTYEWIKGEIYPPSKLKTKMEKLLKKDEQEN